MLFFVWILLLGYLYYQYLVSKTDKAPTRWGTLIEWVTSNITYIPYVSNSINDRFYQNLLFKGCQSYFTQGGKIYYEEELCSVITEDNKTYVVSIVGTGSWSDGSPITVDDLLFTYESVLKNNIWGLSHGKSYDNISIQKLSSNSVSITFPRASKDNMQLFLNFILPAHILEWKDWQWYESTFTKNPITNWCGKLTNSRDNNSVIFDVGNCPNTWIKYYQVKNTSFDKIQKDPGIIDIYMGSAVVPNYNTGTVITNDYAGIFFNMQRGKLSVYGRKNVIGLLNKYIYLPENNLPIVKEHFLFENYPEGVTDKSTIRSVASSDNGEGKIRVIYYSKDPLYTHIASIMKNIMEQEGLIDYFNFEWFEDPQQYIDVLRSKEYDITIQSIALGTKKDISSMFLVDDPVSNPSVYVNPNLATQISDYFKSPLETQYSIKPIIAKLYSTDIPFFILGKSVAYINIKPSISMEAIQRWDIDTVRYKIFHKVVIVSKPQVTKQDLLNWKKFVRFISSELWL